MSQRPASFAWERIQKRNTMYHNLIRDVFWEIGISENQMDFIKDWLRNRQKQGFEISKFSFYGSPGLLWDGGRTGIEVDKISRYVDFISYINGMGIGFNFCAQNIFISKTQRDDEQSNYFLNVLNQSSLNGVVVVLDTLREYIKAKYSQLQIISSINKAYIEQGIHASKQWYERILQEYDYCVVNGNDMYDFELLQSLPNKDRLILLLNEMCQLNCYHRNYHVVMQSIFRINESDKLYTEMMNEFSCPGYQRNMILKNDKLKYYYDIGITHYKLQGRGLNLESYCKELNAYFEEIQDA